MPFKTDMFRVIFKCKHSELKNCAYYSKAAAKRKPNLVHEVPLIRCKRPEYNHYVGQRYNKLEEVVYASKGWQSNKSRGDYFVIEAVSNNDAFDPDASFEDLGVDRTIIENLNKLGIQTPTRIQAKAIPKVLSGRNTLIASETGCGKTLSYLLPLLQQIIGWRATHTDRRLNTPLGLILSPSRELTEQIASFAKDLLTNIDVRTKVIIGGHTKRKMLNPEFEDIDLLVATPGVISKLTTTGIYRMNMVKHLVLDEADTILDDSFSDKMSSFLKKLPLFYMRNDKPTAGSDGTQLTLVGATLPSDLNTTLSQIIVPESLVNITTDQLHRVMPHVPQKFVRLAQSIKPTELLRLVKIDVARGDPVIIFSNKTATCDWISMFLNENHVKCVHLNGDMPFELRIGKFTEFQKGLVNVISCTDVGSRGLNTTRVKHVINYDFPEHSADYIHRCGRTGRVGSSHDCHITNFVARGFEVEYVQKLEKSVRMMDVLPKVNGNISGIIRKRILRKYGGEDILTQ